MERPRPQPEEEERALRPGGSRALLRLDGVTPDVALFATAIDRNDLSPHAGPGEVPPAGQDPRGPAGDARVRTLHADSISKAGTAGAVTKRAIIHPTRPSAAVVVT